MNAKNNPLLVRHEPERASVDVLCPSCGAKAGVGCSSLLASLFKPARPRKGTVSATTTVQRLKKDAAGLKSRIVHLEHALLIANESRDAAEKAREGYALALRSILADMPTVHCVRAFWQGVIAERAMEYGGESSRGYDHALIAEARKIARIEKIGGALYDLMAERLRRWAREAT